VERQIFAHRLVGPEGRTMQCSACKRRFHVNLDNPYQKGEECPVRLRAMYDEANEKKELYEAELTKERDEWNEERAEMDAWVSESIAETERLSSVIRNLKADKEALENKITDLHEKININQEKADVLGVKLVEISGLLGVLQHEVSRNDLEDLSEISSLINGALQVSK